MKINHKTYLKRTFHPLMVKGPDLLGAGIALLGMAIIAIGWHNGIK